MDSNIFEKYAFDRLQMLERENSALKEQLGITDLKTRNNTIKLVLGKIYDIEICEWRINKDNASDFVVALTKEDFKWLEERGFRVVDYDFNILLIVSDMTFYLSYKDNKLTVIEGCLSEEFAKEELLRRVKQLVSKYKQEEESA